MEVFPVASRSSKCRLAEPENSVRASLFECVATLAVNELPEGKWPQLLPFLQQCTESPQQEHRARSVTLFNALAEKVPGSMSQHFPALQAICLKGLKDSNAVVRRASLFAVSGVFGARSLSSCPVAQHCA